MSNFHAHGKKYSYVCRIRLKLFVCVKYLGNIYVGKQTENLVDVWQTKGMRWLNLMNIEFLKIDVIDKQGIPQNHCSI